MRRAPPSVFSGLAVRREAGVLGQAPATEATQAHGFSTIEKVLIISTTISAVGLLLNIYSTMQRQLQENPTPRNPSQRVTVHGVLAGAYMGRGRRGGGKQIEREMRTHAVLVDDEGNWIEKKTVCRRLDVDMSICDETIAAGTLPTCPTCLERVQRRGYLY